MYHSGNKQGSGSSAGEKGRSAETTPSSPLTHANTENEHYEDDARHSLLFEKPMTYIIKEKNNKTNPWVLQIGPKQNRHRKNFSSIKECQKARLEWVLKNKGSSAFKTASENFDSQQAEDEHRDRDRKRARLSPPTARAGISHAMEDEKEEEDNECQHDLGLEYGALAPEIAADNMAREMANAQLKRVMEVPPPPPPLSCTERRIGGAGGGGGGGGGRTKESEEMEEQTEEQTELQMSKSREQQLLKDLAYHQEDLTPQIELRELSKEAVGRYVLISLQSSSALCDQHALKPFINMTKSCTMMRIRQDATQHLGAL